MDKDQFIPELLGYWAVHQVLIADRAFKEQTIKTLQAELDDVMDPDQAKDHEL